MKTPCLRSNRGDTLVLVTVFMIALFAFAALSIDVGNVYTHRRFMQEAVDAAALAAVPDWATGSSVTYVENVGRLYAQTNSLKSDEVVSVIPGTWNALTRSFTANTGGDPTFTTNAVPAVQVIARRAVMAPFWKVISFGVYDRMNPRVEAIAIAGRANAVAGVLPWAVCSNGVVATPTRCQVITVKNGSGCEGSGNFGALNLNPDHSQGGGGDNYRSNIADGYNGIVRVGDYFYPETGNKVGPTIQGLQERVNGLPPYVCTPTSAPPNNKRFAIIPVTGNLGNGKSDPIQILGFWTVALGDPQGGGEVDVTFLEVFIGTEIDPSAPPVIGMANGVALVK